MGKSHRLGLWDVRQAFRLLGDRRDLGADSEAWRLHAFAGLGRLIGARVAIGGAVKRRRPDGPIGVVPALDTGREPNEHAIFLGYLRRLDYQSDPIGSN